MIGSHVPGISSVQSDEEWDNDENNVAEMQLSVSFSIFSFVDRQIYIHTALPIYIHAVYVDPSGMAPRGDARTNLLTARTMPVLILGAFAYVCYDITKQVCSMLNTLWMWDWLLSTHSRLSDLSIHTRSPPPPTSRCWHGHPRGQLCSLDPGRVHLPSHLVRRHFQPGLRCSRRVMGTLSGGGQSSSKGRKGRSVKDRCGRGTAVFGCGASEDPSVGYDGSGQCLYEKCVCLSGWRKAAILFVMLSFQDRSRPSLSRGWSMRQQDGPFLSLVGQPLFLWA